MTGQSRGPILAPIPGPEDFDRPPGAAAGPSRGGPGAAEDPDPPPGAHRAEEAPADASAGRRTAAPQKARKARTLRTSLALQEEPYDFLADTLRACRFAGSPLDRERLINGMILAAKRLKIRFAGATTAEEVAQRIIDRCG